MKYEADSMADLVSIPEVKFYLSRREKRQRTKYAKFLKYRDLNVLSLHSFNQVFQDMAFKIVFSKIKIQPEDRMALFKIACACKIWGTKFMGEQTTYDLFFKGQITIRSFKFKLSRMKNLGLVSLKNKRSATIQEKLVIDTLAIPKERLWELSMSTEYIIIQYDAIITRKMEFLHQNNGYPQKLMDTLDKIGFEEKTTS